MQSPSQSQVEALNALALKLGTTGEYLWKVLVEAQLIEGLIAVGFSILMLAIMTAGVVVGLKAYRYEPKHTFDDSRIVWCVISGALLIVPFIPFTANVYDAFICLLAPEYAAMREIMKALN